MSSVQRAKGFRKVIRQVVFRKPVQKYVTAGSRNCRSMMRAVRPVRQSGPSDSAILAWAQYDLAWEIINGFWDVHAA